MVVSVDATLGDVVAAQPGAAAVFDRLGLDFCCHGDRALAVACDEAGLDADAVVAELAVAPRSDAVGWSDLGPVALAEHIVATHHRYLRAELPLIDGLAEKVLGAHGHRHPELREVRSLVSRLSVELPPHLDAEESVLFPSIATLGSSVGSRAEVAVRMPDLAADHDEVGGLLADLRRLTDGYRTPADGCASFGLLYERLATLEADTHLHVHKENHVLFPAIRRLVDDAA